MKKINSIKQLEAGKKRVVQHQEALEEKIRNNWNELRVNMKPVNLAKDVFSQIISKKTPDVFKNKTMLKGLVSIGAAMIAKRMLQRKLSSLFRKK